jgi:hypothetical protein
MLKMTKIINSIIDDKKSKISLKIENDPSLFAKKKFNDISK